MDHHTKRELLSLMDQLDMAHATGDDEYLDRVCDAVEARMDAIEMSLGNTPVVPIQNQTPAARAAGFQTRLGALRGRW